jgi:pyridoxal phosphate-dependent aminotransferase EpsN
MAPDDHSVFDFEQAIKDATGAKYCLATSSGTAAIHLALMALRVHLIEGAEVWCPAFTFAASAFPVLYCNAYLRFFDSDKSGNIDVELLAKAMAEAKQFNNLPAAVIAVHCYGNPCDMDTIRRICEPAGVPVIEDAAEALGGKIGSGTITAISFNLNKIITCGGGGALISDDGKLIDEARKLANQSKDHAPHYQHSQIGYNYRLAPPLARIGIRELKKLRDAKFYRTYTYLRYLYFLPDIEILPHGVGSNCWLTVALLPDPIKTRMALASQQIESRPVWKPLHLQPVFQHCPSVGVGVCEELFQHGLCLPSGDDLTDFQQRRICDIIKETL